VGCILLRWTIKSVVQLVKAHGTNVLLIIASILLVRSPDFFISVINWDESTFILMGQSLASGVLPYVDYFDNKPPLAFVPYALFTGLFGDSIFAVRLGGSLWVAGSSLIIYYIGVSVWNRSAALIGALSFVYLLSSAPSGGAIMTETLAVLPMLGALAFLTNGINTKSLIYAGLCISAMVLIRLNLVYLALLVGVFVVFVGWREGGIKNACKYALAYGCAGFLPLILVLGTYFVTGHFDEITHFVGVALAYSEVVQENTALEQFAIMVLTQLFLIFVVLLGCAAVAEQWKGWGDKQKSAALLVVLFFVGALSSIVMTGRYYGHYIMQVVPSVSLFFLIASAWVVGRVPSRIKMPTVSAVLICFFVVISIDATVRWGKNQRPDTGASVAEFLKKELPAGEQVLLMKWHVAYFIADLRPINRLFIHPSSMARQYIGDEPLNKRMATLFADQPYFVIAPQEVWYLKAGTEMAAQYKEILLLDYKPYGVINDALVYRRK
jgi:4-amino-4-deoxy-L-arabinose transferase-like glycosyltransferase